MNGTEFVSADLKGSSVNNNLIIKGVLNLHRHGLTISDIAELLSLDNKQVSAIIFGDVQ